MSERLKGKIALIPGIGGGIGGATALAFAAEGATVIGCDISADGVASLLDSAREQGLTIDARVPVDLFKEGEVERFVADVATQYGRIDILVNAAAKSEIAWIEDMTREQFRNVMEGEVELIFWTCKAVWPHMKTNGGSIVNFSSVNAWMAVEGLAGIGHTAGKAATLGMTRQLAMEGAPHGIRANTIAPGFTPTPEMAARLSQLPDFKAVLDRKIMLKRFGLPWDVAQCALYLASDESGYVTGTDIRVDGGMTAW